MNMKKLIAAILLIITIPASLISQREQDSLALVAIYNATGGESWTENTNWLGSQPVSEWHGVTLDLNGRVSELYLPSNNLQGDLPPEIGNLKNLKKLALQVNNLTIPPEIGNLVNLEDLNLIGNQLTFIPAEIGNLIKLHSLLLNRNELKTIPAEIGNLINLKRLNFESNLLTSIPEEIANLNLLYLKIAKNSLSVNDIKYWSGIFPGPFMNFSPQFFGTTIDTSQFLGVDFTFHANLHYETELQYKWFKNIENQVSNEKTFTIASLQYPDSGTYSVEVRGFELEGIFEFYLLSRPINLRINEPENIVFKFTSGNSLCEGDEIEIKIYLFEELFDYELDNQLFVQISDENGSFDIPVLLAQIDTSNSLVTTIPVPESLEFGTSYLMRILSTNPELHSDSLSFTIYWKPTSTFELNAEKLCGSESVRLFYTGNATGQANYDWNFYGGNIISSNEQEEYELNWNTPGNKNIELTVTENGCNSEFYSISLPVYNPVSSFSMDDIVCENLNTTISFIGSSSDSALFDWSFNNANIISGSGMGPYTVNWAEPGTKTVSLTIDDNGCIVSTVKTINHNPIPIININAPEKICFNSRAVIEYSGTATTAASYNWNFSGGNIISGSGPLPHELFWPTSGLKTISLQVEENGCSSITSKSLWVNPQTQPNPICMVTVNESLKNMIAWELPSIHPYDSIVVYKESIQSEIYNIIGKLPVYESQYFIDSGSNPAQNSSKYKIAVIDTCGYETAPSAFHKTMHLTISQGVGGAWNLIWDPYVGFDYSTIDIYRGASDNSITKITGLASGNFTYTDLFPPDNTQFYFIEVVKPNPCFINTKKKSSYSFQSTRSNIAKTLGTSINPFNKGFNRIFPNPFTNTLTVQNAKDVKRISFLNLLGQTMLEIHTSGQETVAISTAELPKGLYMVRFTGENGEGIVRTLVKE
jgi:Leucine-rich repeat (LRR) protein